MTRGEMARVEAHRDETVERPRTSTALGDDNFFAEFDSMVARRLRQQRWIMWSAIAGFLAVERVLTWIF